MSVKCVLPADMKQIKPEVESFFAMAEVLGDQGQHSHPKLPDEPEIKESVLAGFDEESPPKKKKKYYQ